jgi:7,8-dihydro-6-hydroxymethylpterin-pyrophosphokinase
VLMPLAEIAPDISIPRTGRVKTLLAACRNQKIRRLGEP